MVSSFHNARNKFYTAHKSNPSRFLKISEGNLSGVESNSVFKKLFIWKKLHYL